MLASLRLPDPWQSRIHGVPNLRSLKLWVSDNFHCRNQIALFPILQFPDYFLKISVFADETPLQWAWDGKGEWRHSHSHRLVLSCRIVCATLCYIGETAMVSLLKLGLVFSLKVPYRMKPTTWRIISWKIVINPQLPPPLQHPKVHPVFLEQDTIREKKAGIHSKWYYIVKIIELWRKKDLLLLSMQRQILSENTDNNNNYSIHEKEPRFVGGFSFHYS